MFLIKASLTGLVGFSCFSLCMANINGIVTDTGTSPIAGVVVQLEKGGKTATTGADGSFTLVIGSSAILPSNGKSLPNGLSARISGNLLSVTIAQRAVVEVAAFDLNGKSLSTVRKALDAGSHSIALPLRGAGVYLYRVKSENREFALKGKAVGGVSSGSAVFSQSSTSNQLSKQAKAAVAINDVIAATKAGLLNYRCIIGNSDTSGVVIKMIANAGNVVDTDGNVYQTVRIGNQVWMTEHLRVTKYNDGSAIPFDTSTATWNSATTPMYCFYNNTTNSDSIKKYGALYNWYVVNPLNPKMIAPTGWHVPTDAEWNTLQNNLIAKGYNWDGTTTGNKIAKALAAKTDWYTYSTTGTTGCDLTTNNSSGFSALPAGYRYYDGSFSSQGNYGDWWNATESDASDGSARSIYYGHEFLYGASNSKRCGFSVRLVKN